MARINPTATKETPAQERARKAAEQAARAAAQPSPARRGEDDDVPPPRRRNKGNGDAPQGDQEADGTVVSMDARSPHVELGRERVGGFSYEELPDGQTPLEQLAHVQRGINRANLEFGRQAGHLQEGYVLSAGRYCRDLVDHKLHKAAGYKSLDEFASRELGGMASRDVYDLAKMVPVYESIEGYVERPLSKSEVLMLYPAYSQKEGTQEEKRAACLELWQECLRQGQTTARGIAQVRKLLAAGDPSELKLREPKPEGEPKAIEVARRSEQALMTQDAFKRLKDEDPEAAKKHVEKVDAYLQSLQEALGS